LGERRVDGRQGDPQAETLGPVAQGPEVLDHALLARVPTVGGQGPAPGDEKVDVG
jgi:hypothetical protein